MSKASKLIVTSLFVVYLAWTIKSCFYPITPNEDIVPTPPTTKNCFEYPTRRAQAACLLFDNMFSSSPPPDYASMSEWPEKNERTTICTFNACPRHIPLTPCQYDMFPAEIRWCLFDSIKSGTCSKQDCNVNFSEDTQLNQACITMIEIDSMTKWDAIIGV
jgi:hypothetical protein